MLFSATKTGVSASFVYDPHLRQTQKTVGTIKTKYAHSVSHMLEQYNGTTNVMTTRYVYSAADEPVLAQPGNTGAVGNKLQIRPLHRSQENPLMMYRL